MRGNSRKDRRKRYALGRLLYVSHCKPPNDMLEGEYVAESTGTHVRVYRNNPVPPHVEYEIISDPLP